MPTSNPAEKVKVTHTLTRRTHDRLRELVVRGEIRDASSFIEEALEASLRERKLRQLALELEAYEDPALVADTVRRGDEGIGDVAAELRRRA